MNLWNLARKMNLVEVGNATRDTIHLKRGQLVVLSTTTGDDRIMIHAYSKKYGKYSKFWTYKRDVHNWRIVQNRFKNINDKDFNCYYWSSDLEKLWITLKQIYGKIYLMNILKKNDPY